jgi:hypothetical protein
VLAAFGTDHKLWTEHLLTRLATTDARYTRWTAEDLAGAQPALRGHPQWRLTIERALGYQEKVDKPMGEVEEPRPESS